MTNMNNRSTMGTSDMNSSTAGRSANRDWSTERDWWRNNYRSRPYVKADRGFDQYEAGYRYGTDSANRNRGRSWKDTENELRSGWDSYEHRGNNKSTWDEVKDSVKDAWDHVTGDGEDSRRTDETARQTR